ncbi:DUF4915 domain-containing protein [Pseudomonas sp. LB3P58]
MPNAFENLLISSPNGGGLLLIHNGLVFRLDDINTTGISLSGDKFLRGFQPEGLVFYQGNQTSEDSGTSIPDIHDVLIVDSSLYAVGTNANEVLQLDMNAIPVRRWTFPGENDAKHINCLALWNQRIVFSAFGDFTDHREYKGNTTQAGFVQDLHTGERLIEALSQPHSLVPFGDKLLLANSETRELREYDGSAKLLRSKTLDGYTRGICVQDNILYIGLSRSRNIDSSAIVNANLVALDLQSWEELGRIELPISEIYSVLPIEDIDALPSVLAGISQRAAVDYRHAINTRDEQIQELKNNNERLTLMEKSLTEHLDTRNKQYTEHVVALTERDTRIVDLAQGSAALMHELEQSAALRADDSLKLVQSQSYIQTLEADLQEYAQQSLILQQHSKDIAEQLQETLPRIHIQEQQIQDLTATRAKNNERIAELIAQDQQTKLQLDQTTQDLLIEKQQLLLMTDVIQEKKQQLEAAQMLLADVTRKNNAELEAARVALADVTREKNAQLEAARVALADVTREKNTQLEAARVALADVTREKNTQLEAARVALADVTQAKDDQLDALGASLAERDSQMSVMSQQLEAITQINRVLLESHSWRWTRPLRDLRRLLRL